MYPASGHVDSDAILFFPLMLAGLVYPSQHTRMVRLLHGSQLSQVL